MGAKAKPPVAKSKSPKRKVARDFIILIVGLTLLLISLTEISEERESNYEDREEIQSETSRKTV